MQISDLFVVANLLKDALKGTVPGKVLEAGLALSNILIKNADFTVSSEGADLRDAIKAYEARVLKNLDKV